MCSALSPMLDLQRGIHGIHRGGGANKKKDQENSKPTGQEWA